MSKPSYEDGLNYIYKLLLHVTQTQVIRMFVNINVKVLQDKQPMKVTKPRDSKVSL